VSPKQALTRYRAMRDFGQTPEPAGATTRQPGTQGIYVIQKHAATRLHYDFRLELDGTLKSWAVPREPSFDPRVKRLAVEVEDHPIEYAKFSGTIPKGHYGAGKVEIWDKGRWRPEGDPRADLKKGRLHFALEGGRLAGRWTLVRMEGPDEDPKKPQWLLMRAKQQEETAAVPARKPGAGAGAKKVAKSAKAKTVRGPARPLPEHVEFQLATPATAVPEGEDWLHELKLDGYRAQATLDRGRVAIRTRRGHDWTARFPALAAAVGGLDARRAILDGEIVALRPDGTTDFQALQNALDARRSEALVYCVFDLLHEDGEDLMPLPLEQRKKRLAALLKRSPKAEVLRFVKHAVGGGAELFVDACRVGLEGVISKRRDAPYRPGRGTSWLKIKCVGRQEFVIGGYTITPDGRGTLAALLLGVHDEKTGKLVPVGRTGTGMTSKERSRLLETLRPLAVDKSPFDPAPPAGDRRGKVTWVKPRHVAEVEFRAWTSDGRLRQASYKGMRLDKAARQVVRERPRNTEDVRLSNPDKVLFPDVGATKRDLLDYVRVVGERMLPHVAGRALMVLRCPNGVGQSCFYQKHPAAEARASDRPRGPSARASARTNEEEWLSIRNQRGLEDLVQAGAVEIHAWGSRLDRIEFPDRLAFDLDPGPGVPWSEVAKAAHDVRARLKELELESFLKTTGGKGLHVVVPIARRHEWPEAKKFCHDFALAMAADEPHRFTAALAKARRTNRIFIDYLRNGRGATWVVPYSTRAREGATVSMPLSWEELTPRLDPTAFHLRGVLAKGLPRRDPWKGLADVRQALPRKTIAPARIRGSA
jgi:bifunctional non-homologous end joining protein LigD